MWLKKDQGEKLIQNLIFPELTSAHEVLKIKNVIIQWIS